MKKIILNTIALVLCVGNLFGQFFNDGAQVTVQQGALLHIQGDFTNQGGEVTNDGLIEIGGNWENTVMGFPLTPGGGGTVQFVGSMQTIGGDFPTLFNDIQFQGNQTVTLSSNIGIGNSIDLNNGIIDLNEKVLHILNPQASAITVAGGGVRAESSDNYGFVRWDIGVQGGQSYEVPFVNNADTAIPLHFEVNQAGQDSTGYILFSTYAVAEDNTPLPVGVTNVDVNGDGSGTALVDRFWIVNAVDYSVAPFGTLGMSYDSANEIGGSNNIAPESLEAIHWNGPVSTWDFIADNTVDGSTVTAITNDTYGTFALSSNGGTGEDGDTGGSTVIYTAHLGGSQEVCPKVSPAFGMITASLTGNTLSVSGSFQNLIGDFNAAIGGGSHIHKNIAGRNGGVEIVINASVDSDLKGGAYEASENTFELTEEQVMALQNRELYINIHSTLFPSGEIRGQLLPPADHLFQANLLGINEVPANNSAATGNVLLELTGNELTVSGSFDDFTSPVATALAGGAHLHTGVAGVNGGVTLPLNISLDMDQMGGVFEAANNKFTLTDAQVADITAQGLYINIHSESNMPGEIRGQVSPFAAAYLVADLSGDQEVPAINSSSTGRLHVTYNGDQTISVSGSFNGLEGDLNTALAGGAHLHLAPRGENGGVIFPLNSQVSADNRNGVFLSADNTFTLSSDQVTALFEEGIYVNIHSLVNAPGELRGQLVGQTLSSCGNSVVASPVVGCPTPELPTVTRLTRTRILIEWLEVTGAEGYVIQARLKGRADWAITTALIGPSARIWAVADREFEYRIKTICTDGTESTYTDILEFSTIGNLTRPVSQARNAFKDDIILTEQLLNPSDILIAPNPFVNTIQLTYQSTSDNARVQIYHVSGQKIKDQILSKNTITHSINVSNAAPGMYLLLIQEKGQEVFSQKLIKQ